MKSKNVLSIMLTKFSMVYKLILFLVILSLICAILLGGAFLPILKGLKQDFDHINIDGAVQDYLRAFLRGSDISVEYDVLMNKIASIGDLFNTYGANITAAIVVLFVIIFIFAIFYYMAYYSTSDILHSFMSSDSKFGFASNYIYNIKKSFMFAILYAPYAIIFYVVGTIITVAVGLLLSAISPILGFSIAYLIMLLLLALRRALTVYWLPIMVVEQVSVTKAFVANFKMLKDRFWNMFGAYVMVYLISILLVAVSFFITLGIGVIVGYAVSWFLMQIIDMVDYYNCKGYKYYIDDQMVVDPTKRFRDAVSDLS